MAKIRVHAECSDAVQQIDAPRYEFEQFQAFADRSPKRKERDVIARVRLNPKKAKIDSGRDAIKSRIRFDDLINGSAVAEVGMRSHADFALCCAAVERGWPKDEVWASAREVGKFAERGEEYFERTWDKAKWRIKESKFEKIREKQADALSSEAEDTTSRNGKGPSDQYGPHNENNAAKPKKKPEVPMHGGSIKITETAETFGKLLAQTHRMFRRGGIVQRVVENEDGFPALQVVKPPSLPSDFEEVAQVVKLIQSEGGAYTEPTTSNRNEAELILHSSAFQGQLPPLRVMSPCPVLVDIEGKLVQVHGYNRERGILARGPEIDIPPLNEAKQLLSMITAQYNYVDGSDKARHYAALITPALIHGQLLGRGNRVPVDLSEADEPQTGKGYRNKLTAAIYNQDVAVVKQSKSGIASIEEELGHYLAAGRQFISLDNIRGRVDIPALESYLTEDTYLVRIAYSAPMTISTKDGGVVIMFTSNAADTEKDLAKRSSIVRLRKHPPEFQFTEFKEGALLDHVRANWAKFLGAVFAVVQEWHRQGMPKTKPGPRKHDFTAWERTLGWIVENLIGTGPLMEGHSEIQDRISTPGINWLRDVAIIVSRENRLGDWLRSSDIVSLLEDTGVPIPSMRNDTNMEDDEDSRKIYTAMGKKLSRCFRSRDSLQVDRFQVEREDRDDGWGRPRKVHKFTLISDGEDSRSNADSEMDLFGDERQEESNTTSETDGNAGVDPAAETCDDGTPHAWEVMTESDGKVRRFCVKCKYFGGFVENDGF